MKHRRPTIERKKIQSLRLENDTVMPPTPKITGFTLYRDHSKSSSGRLRTRDDQNPGFVASRIPHDRLCG